MPKSPIAAIIPIPKELASDQNRGGDPQKAALDAISRIAAGVDAKPKPRAANESREAGDDPNGFLALF